MRIWLAVAAKFELETMQLDAVNAFVYSELDQKVFMRIPPWYVQSSHVFKLNRAFYGLRRSLLLWQKKPANEIKKLSFKEILKVSCIVQKDRYIGFFYVDDIVFAFKKE